jgi:5,10-methylenetetrahydromethanopterin reductase
MQIGMLLGTADGQRTRIAELVAQARQAEADGFASGWFSNIFGMDALTAVAVCGQATTGLALGTAVVPTYPRHPYTLAQQALSAQAAAGGHLLLGIGPSHQPVVEGMWGLSYARPLTDTREYLEVLLPLLEQGHVKFQGSTYRVEAPLRVPGATPCPVLLAALGAKMLDLAGRTCAGTVTAWTGPKTLESHVIPVIRAATADAGRPAPRIVAMLTIAVTQEVDAARAALARGAQIYGTLPSYRAMLDREGAAGPADVALFGDEDAIGEQLDHLAAIGVTDLVWDRFPARPDPAETLARTQALLLKWAAAHTPV